MVARCLESLRPRGLTSGLARVISTPSGAVLSVSE
jgi:hypothetical protein